MEEISIDHYKNWLKNQDPIFSKAKIPPPHPNRIKIDSRHITPGDWFLPIKGNLTDGHQFIPDVLKRGASGFFYEKSLQSSINSEHLKFGIGINHCLSTLQKIAKGYRSLFNIPIISLTGSSGKTTTKEMIAAIVNISNHCLLSPGNYNNTIGLPLTLLQLQPSHTHCILEMGARQQGDINFLVSLARPTHRVLLNIGSAHIGIFGSVDAIANTKLEIFDDINPSDILIANSDDPRINSWIHSFPSKNVLTFGSSPEATIKLHSSPQWDEIKISTPNSEISFNPILKHTTAGINMTAATAIAYSLDISADDTIYALSRFAGLPGRYKIHHHQDSIIIDDTYNANPESMAYGLKSLAQHYPDQTKTLILGDMLELGPEEQLKHREIGKLCQTIPKLHQLVTIGKLSQFISSELKAKEPHSNKVLHYKTVEQALLERDQWDRKSEVTYAKASNGIGLSKLISSLLI